MVLRRLYARPLDAKPACRRHLFPQSRNDLGNERLPTGICLCHVCPWLAVELWRCDHCGTNWTHKERSVLVCPLPTKATRESLVSSSGSNVQKSTTFDSFPELWAFLTCYTCPDGSKRQGGRLSLSCDAGLWTLALTDPSTSLYACLSGQTIDDLVLQVEARLSESTMPWRPSNFSPKGRK
jgi:hypothetical protein